MENSGKFDFLAPQFVESLSEAATLAEQDGADKFFDSETFSKYSVGSPSKKKSNEDMETFYTPLERNIIENGRRESILSGQDNEVPNKVNADGNKENQLSSKNLGERQILKAKKRSSKTSNTDEKRITRQEKCKFDGIILPTNSEKEKEHTMLTRQDKVIKTPTIELRTRQIIREAKKRKASPKPMDACFSKKHASKFMSLAEKIMHFHEDTPPRFKTRFISLEEKENKNTHLKPTVPHSPKLITKSRIRPNENMTTEDQQKYVFKASKLNMKIFGKPDNSDHVKLKSPTKPKPFVSSEVTKKELPNEVFQFQGKSKQYDSCNPLNSSITSNYSNRNRRRMPLRSVKQEQFLDEDDAYGGMACLTKANHSTQLQPFSFDERDKEILKRKEEKIKKLQEEMSKVPVFHAAPVPSFVSSSTCNSTLKSAVSSISLLSDVGSVKGGVICSDSENSNGDTTFKAKFPAVLYKEPFVPQKPERPLLETNHIQLNTEKRARKRQEFEKELKLKEERREQERKEVMALIEQIEKEKLTELRKKLVHKAQPVPQYPSVQKER